ncbi:lamin tail domain-containing protein [Candidatus Bathyarchaeota archaeon]|nr:lamin tail domain-containing protein [Candidatus Bathyarchaeota archaeon]
MKKRSVLIAQLLILLMLAMLGNGTTSSKALFGWDVVINEFNPNPSTGPQWVELFNPSNFPQSIGLWRIIGESFGFTYQMPPEASIAAKGHQVLDLGFAFLNPVGDILYLVDNHGLWIDITPSLSKPGVDDMAWARVPNGFDSNLISDWKLQSATKGSSNDVVAPPPSLIPTISCAVDSPQVGIGSGTTIRVVIGPPRVVTVTIQARRLEETAWSNLTTATTDALGRYDYPWTPGTMGAYNVRAYVSAAGAFPEMFSLPVFLTVTKILMGLSCSVTHTTVGFGQDLATYGYLTPAVVGVTVMLTYRKPTGPPIIKYVQTGSGGLFNDTKFTPQEAGDWNVTASWDGDETHMAATSPLAYFYVESPPFLFGMWLIIALVVSVSVSAVVLAAGLSTKAKPKPPRRVALCPQCRSVLLYVPSLRSWYCPKCRRPIP